VRGSHFILSSKFCAVTLVFTNSTAIGSALQIGGILAEFEGHTHVDITAEDDEIAGMILEIAVRSLSHAQPGSHPT
jgi:hypothetical protein